jgi:hypothetical protein
MTKPPLLLPALPARAVSASRQRQPAFSRVERAEAVAVGPVPDCASNLFMRAGLPCLTFLYAPAVSLCRRGKGNGVCACVN